jgi:hypothetical protein
MQAHHTTRLSQDDLGRQSRAVYKRRRSAALRDPKLHLDDRVEFVADTTTPLGWISGQSASFGALPKVRLFAPATEQLLPAKLRREALQTLLLEFDPINRGLK